MTDGLVNDDLAYPKTPRLQKNGHPYKCPCRSCIGRRNRAKGKRAQARHTKALAAATGSVRQFWSAWSEEETAGLKGWQHESKKGQLPKFILNAFAQAERAVAIGSGRKPLLVLEPEGTRQALAVLRLEDLLELIRAVESAP